jgi:hypothetical protein
MPFLSKYRLRACAEAVILSISGIEKNWGDSILNSSTANSPSSISVKVPLD